MILQPQFPGSPLDKILILAADFNYKRSKPLRLTQKKKALFKYRSQTRLTSVRFLNYGENKYLGIGIYMK